MRPVVRDVTNGWKYPDTTMVKSRPIQATLKKKSIFPVSGTTIYRTDDLIAIMAQMAEFNAGAAKWGNLASDYKILMNYLMTNVFTDGTNSGYGNARGSLITNFGQYCSYCGLPVFDSSLAVEHMLPKSIFPDVMMCYPNFLLACPNCNSVKGDQPYYSWAKDWYKKGSGSSAPPTYDQVKLGGYFYAIWPDQRTLGTTAINDDTYKAFQFTLEHWNGMKEEWEAFSSTDAFDLGNVWKGTSGGWVLANVKGTDYSVVSSYTYWGSGFVPDRAKNLSVMMGLNQYDPDNIKMSDRRAMNRTIVFFEALAALNRLQSAIGMKAPQPYLDLLFSQLLTTARYSGFYEVWIAVIYTICPPGVSDSPYAEFVTQTCDPANPTAYFPSTDASRLPK